MTQDQWIVRLMEIGSIGAIIAVAQWLTVYTVLQPWWKNSIGRSLVLFAHFSAVTPALFILSLFFHLGRILAWIEVAVLFAYVPALLWRSVIWIRSGRADEHGSLPCGEKD